MAKALGGIITLAAAVVVNVVPGLGQLASAAILIGAAVASQAIAALAAPRASKPETAETSIKTERPPRVRAYGTSRLYGASLLYESVNGTALDVWAFHDGRIDAVVQAYLNDDKVTISGNTVATLPDKRYQSGHVKVGWTLGQTPGTAFSAITALFPAWDASHRGDGVVLGYLIKEPEKDKYFLETYPQGDGISLSLAARWSFVFDPRDPSQDPHNDLTWKWSDNAVLALLDYLMTERGFDWSTRFVPQLAKLLDAINNADEAVPLPGGGSEKRYRTALSYKETEEPASIITSLRACFDGWHVINEAGHVVVYGGKYYTPTVSIGPEQIASYRHQHGVEDENRVNEIGVTYVSALHDYSTVEAESWRDEDDISASGRVNASDLGAVIPSYTQGRRLAKRQMSRTNAPNRGSVTTTFGGRAVLGERYINLRVEEAGAVFFDGAAEIIGAERDRMTGGVTFDWIEADPNGYAWNAATESGEGAPVGNRYAPEPLPAPVIGAIAPTYGQNTAYNTPGAKLTINITSPLRSDLTWYVRTRPTGSSAWLEETYPDIDPSGGVTLQTGFLPLAELDVEVSYQTADGRTSPWASIGTIDTDTQLPSPVMNLSASGTSPIVVDWTASQAATSYRVDIIV